jgi:hypothetical protein
MSRGMEGINKVKQELDRLVKVGDFDYAQATLADLSSYKSDPRIRTKTELDVMKPLEKLVEQRLNIIRQRYCVFTTQEISELETELRKIS